MGISVVKERVTPSKAKKWLEKNTNNRPAKSSYIRLMAGAMAAGQWKLNGDCIRFNGDGTLVDGQKRLMACVESGVSFDTYVATGIDHDCFDTIDQGQRRSLGDIFARQGRPHYCILAAAIKALWRFNRGYTNKGGKNTGPMRADEANEILEKNPQIVSAVQESRELSGSKGLIGQGILAALIFLTRKKDKALSASFWEGVLKGVGLEKIDPAYMLRERLIENKGSAEKLTHENTVALCIKAWNCARGDTFERLKFDKREEFPKIK